MSFKNSFPTFSHQIYFSKDFSRWSSDLIKIEDEFLKFNMNLNLINTNTNTFKNFSQANRIKIKFSKFLQNFH